MAGARIRIGVDAAAAQEALRGLAHAGGDLRPALDEIGQRLATSVVERFERETAPDGAPWRPSRRAEDEGGQTLTDSARLRQSIVHAASAREAVVGTNLVYGAIHQLGSDPAGGRPSGIPARPYLGLDGADEATIESVALRHLGGAL